MIAKFIDVLPTICSLKLYGSIYFFIKPRWEYWTLSVSKEGKGSQGDGECWILLRDIWYVLPLEQSVFLQLFLSQMTEIQLVVLLVMVGDV